MGIKFKGIVITNRTTTLYSTFSMILSKFDSNKIKIDEKPYKNILIYDIGYMTNQRLEILKNQQCKNPLYLIIGKVNGYSKQINRNKYLTLVSTNKSKEMVKKYKDLWSKIKDFIREITKNSDDYDEKYVKIKFNLDDDCPLNKTLKIVA